MEDNSKKPFPLGIDFFTFFVHELKAPLMHLQWRLQKLKNQPTNKSVIHQMDQDCQLLFQMIHDGLNIKQLENSNVMHSKWHAFSKCIHWAQSILQHQCKTHQIQLHISGIWKDIEVYIDMFWMRSAITNLLQNAIQHSKVGDSVFLHTKWSDQNTILFSVCDQGAGIPVTDQKRVFDRFFTHRHLNAKKLLFQGTGLGLYITRLIAKAHGGSVYVESKPNQPGCTFYLEIPKAQSIIKQKIS